jgi:ABC-type Co2+ transport system permease subunit
MRTVIIVFGGLVLWAVFLGIAKFIAGANASSSRTATIAFTGTWLVVAVANMWIGVAQAGYSFLEELPIFLLIFLVPVAVASLCEMEVSLGARCTMLARSRVDCASHAMPCQAAS